MLKNKKALTKISRSLLSLVLLTVILAVPLMTLAQTRIDPMEQLNNAPNLKSLGNGGESGLVKTIDNVIGVLLGFLGLLFVILVLYAGFLWMTAAGDDAKIKKAKQIIIAATIGVVIIFAAYAITSFVIKNISNATGAS